MVTYLKQSKHILSILTLCILLLFPRIYHVSLVHTFESLTANLKAIIKSKGKGRINLEDLENGKLAKWLSNAFPIILICWVVNIINSQAYLIDWKMIGNNYKYKPLLKKLEKEQGSLCSIIVLDFILFCDQNSNMGWGPAWFQNLCAFPILRLLLIFKRNNQSPIFFSFFLNFSFYKGLLNMQIWTHLTLWTQYHWPQCIGIWSHFYGNHWV